MVGRTGFEHSPLLCKLRRHASPPGTQTHWASNFRCRNTVLTCNEIPLLLWTLILKCESQHKITTSLVDVITSSVALIPYGHPIDFNNYSFNRRISTSLLGHLICPILTFLLIQLLNWPMQNTASSLIDANNLYWTLSLILLFLPAVFTRRTQHSFIYLFKKTNTEVFKSVLKQKQTRNTISSHTSSFFLHLLTRTYKQDGHAPKTNDYGTIMWRLRVSIASFNNVPQSKHVYKKISHVAQ